MFIFLTAFFYYPSLSPYNVLFQKIAEKKSALELFIMHAF